MIRVVQFRPHHIAAMDVQAWQRDGLLAGETYAQCGPAWTALDRHDRPIFSGGLAWVGPGYAHAWAVMAKGKGAALVAITREVRHVVTGSGFRRIELFCDARRREAIRWAELLGFEREGIKRAALADGGDVIVFAMVRQAQQQEGSCRQVA